MAELFTPEQARAWLRANNLKTGKSIQDAFINDLSWMPLQWLLMTILQTPLSLIEI
jgi:hypothetical protein